MTEGKINPLIESMAESGEAATPITPQMAIQCAKASLLLSSLRPPTLRRSSDASTSLRAEDMIKLRRQLVDLSGEICWLRQQRKKSSHLEHVEVILAFASFCLFLFLIALI